MRGGRSQIRPLLKLMDLLDQGLLRRSPEPHPDSISSSTIPQWPSNARSRETMHVHVIPASYENTFPETRVIAKRAGFGLPPLAADQRGTPIGVIFIRRTEVRPFSDEQV